MSGSIWLLPLLPFTGAVVLALVGRRLPRSAAAAVGAGSVGLAAIAAAVAAWRFVAAPPPGGAAVETLWTWISSGGLGFDVALRLDALSVVMVLVVTGVGFLIHLYSIDYMKEGGPHGAGADARRDTPRFFAAMNLFVGSMLVLVLADDLLLLYLGWEGVGLCSYLLIGFWYRDPANGRAARKAFVVTRIGDAAMAIGLFLLIQHLGTLHIPTVLERAGAEWAPGTPLAVAVAALLLGGALGKSAQLPLQTWLPDAMAGPTPVSALIHAATMVTAGVYLIARLHTLFALAPAVLAAVAAIGAATLVVAGCSALVQRDIKRVLAYSTISQLGYMFLALGVGAWSAAIFHLVTHAFFKALLFLGAGAVILALHHEQDLARMGGLRRELPLVYWTFLAGAAALAGVPLVTAGFFSKDLVLWQAWSSPRGGAVLWAIGVAAALLTALYAFRLVFLVFHGERRTAPATGASWRLHLPLAVLAALSVAGGWIEIPLVLGGRPLFTGFLDPVFAGAAASEGRPGGGAGAAGGGGAGDHAGETAAHDPAEEALTMAVAGAASLAGIALAWLAFGRRRTAGAPLQAEAADERAERVPLVPLAVARFWRDGWGFDRFYDALLVRPFTALARANRADVVDLLPHALAALAGAGHAALRQSQTGRLRWYAAALVAGAVLALALVALP